MLRRSRGRRLEEIRQRASQTLEQIEFIVGQHARRRVEGEAVTQRRLDQTLRDPVLVCDIVQRFEMKAARVRGSGDGGGEIHAAM